jgi:hypothetical protein
MRKYEVDNLLAVETVFGLIDFDKFKQSVLRYKKDSAGLKSEETANLGTALGQQDENIFWKYDAEDPNDPKSGWVKKAESKPNEPMKFTMHQKVGDDKINILRT